MYGSLKGSLPFHSSISSSQNGISILDWKLLLCSGSSTPDQNFLLYTWTSTLNRVSEYDFPRSTALFNPALSPWNQYLYAWALILIIDRVHSRAPTVTSLTNMRHQTTANVGWTNKEEGKLVVWVLTEASQHYDARDQDCIHVVLWLRKEWGGGVTSLAVRFSNCLVWVPDPLHVGEILVLHITTHRKHSIVLTS